MKSKTVGIQMKIFKTVLLMLSLLSVNIYANLVEDGIVASNSGKKEKAFKVFEQACDENNPLACQYVAEAYNQGITVKIDVSKALEHYTKSCSLGLGKSCLFIPNYAIEISKDCLSLCLRGV